MRSRAAALPRRGARAAATRLQAWRLGRSPHATVRRVAAALHDSYRNRFPPESLRWFERIESMRRELAASSDRIEMVSYGAGLPTSGFTDEQMRRGFVARPEIGSLIRTASLPPATCRLLHAIVRTVGVRRGIELGTCLGVSAAYQAAALEDRDGASFVTCEGAPDLAALASSNLERLGLRQCRVSAGRFDETLPAIAAELAPVEYAFVDGHHDEDATVRYFDLLLPYLADSAVIVFDDIRWSDGMARAWTRIRHHRDVRAAVDLRRLGLVVVGPEGERARSE